MIVLGSFIVGILTGLAAVHTRAGRALPWKKLIRVQVLFVASTLSFVTAWRLGSVHDLVQPLLLELSLCLLLAWSILTRKTSVGQAVLQSWSVWANSGYWVVPVASAVLGPAAVALVSIADRLGSVRVAICVHLLRRDAPQVQKANTVLVDQAPVLALILGVMLRLFAGPAPTWTNIPLIYAGPILATSGVVLYMVGNTADRLRDEPPVRVDKSAWTRWGLLIGVRALLLCLAALIVHDNVFCAMCALWAFSAPTFSPVQLTLLYGYRDAVVVLASRACWALAPVGLVLASLIATR